uniref:Uncharacterized protein n=1 Tax=Anguilla anguilla TaxID=7936 RepID=A0A0E9PEJ8_ANGAN
MLWNDLVIPTGKTIFVNGTSGLITNRVFGANL